MATEGTTITGEDTAAVAPESFTDDGAPDLSLDALIASGHANPDDLAGIAPDAIRAVEEARPNTPKLAKRWKETAPKATAQKPTENAPTEGEALANAPPPDAPGEAEKPTEPEAKPEEPKPEPAEKPGLNVQLRNAEKALVAKKVAFSKERSEFDGYKAGVESQIAKARAQLDAQRAEVEEAAKVLNAVRTDPVGLLRALGWDDRVIAERLVNGGRPGQTEAQLRVDRELATLRHELAAEREERNRERRAREESTLVQQTYAEFVSLARGDAARWPVASQFSDAKLRREGDRIAEASGNDPTLTYADILDRIEEEEGAELARVQRSGKNGKPAARTVKPAPRPPPPPTLTSADAGERASDDGFDVLTATQEELDRRTFEEADKIKANGGRR
jgi:hypothetical protein